MEQGVSCEVEQEGYVTEEVDEAGSVAVIAAGTVDVVVRSSSTQGDVIRPDGLGF